MPFDSIKEILITYDTIPLICSICNLIFSDLTLEYEPQLSGNANGRIGTADQTYHKRQ